MWTSYRYRTVVHPRFRFGHVLYEAVRPTALSNTDYEYREHYRCKYNYSSVNGGSKYMQATCLRSLQNHLRFIRFFIFDLYTIEVIFDTLVNYKKYYGGAQVRASGQDLDLAPLAGKR